MDTCDTLIPGAKPEFDRQLVEAVFECYGYDFREYHPEMVCRQIAHCMQKQGMDEPSAFLQSMLQSKELFLAFLGRLSVSVSTMFRDPLIYRTLRERVLPMLATYPRIRIWSAGIAGGQEVYSLAILLWEADLYHRSLIYATDFNPSLVRQARLGVLPLDRMSEFTSNYHAMGGRQEFSRYYFTTDHSARIVPELRKNIVFSTHNLVTDGSFNEFHLVVCRNVVIYFERALTDRVLTLFHKSLVRGGFLWLGAREQLQFYQSGKYFEPFGSMERIYRKI